MNSPRTIPITKATTAQGGPTKVHKATCVARSHWRWQRGRSAAPRHGLCRDPECWVAGVSPSIHISSTYATASAPCKANNQLRALSGNRNQQMVTSAAFLATAIRSSVRTVSTRVYSALIADAVRWPLTSLVTALDCPPAVDFGPTHT
jgi:hypothetical protein